MYKYSNPMHQFQSNVFFFKKTYVKTTFYSLKIWKWYFYLPLKRHRSAKASAVYHQGASRDESKPQILGFNNKNLGRSYVVMLKFIHLIFFRLFCFFVMTSDFIFHRFSWQLKFGNLPSLVSEVEKTNRNFCSRSFCDCEVRPGELHHRWHLLKLHCFNHQNEKKSNNLLIWDIFSWFTGACLNMYSFISYVFPSKLTRRCFVLKMTVPMVPGFWSSGCIVAACQAGNVAMRGANAERFRVNGSDGRIRSAQWRWKNEKKQLLQDG